jgi:hypothetical protein
MDLGQLLRHFFETEDPSELTEAEFAIGLERLKIGFGVEHEPSRKFALWTLLETLGEAPLPADAFAKEPQLKAAAEQYLTVAFRLQRFQDGDG